MLNLGDKVKDRITGLTGIIVARTEWINGCVRCTVQPQELKDGRPVESCCFDVEELSLVAANVVEPKAAERRTNGPMPNAGGVR